MEHDNEPECLYTVFLAIKVTPMASSTQIENSTWLLDPLTTMRPAPRPWPFVEQSKLIISLGEQDKSDITHIHGKVHQDDVPIYGTVLMVSEMAGVEQEPYNSDNQVLVLADSEASDNYFDRNL